MTPREVLLMDLLAELQALNPSATGDGEAELAGRLSLRSATGQLVGGDALLCDFVVESLISSLTSLNAYLKAGTSEPAMAGGPADDLPELNPEAAKQLVDLFAEIDADGDL